VDADACWRQWVSLDRQQVEIVTLPRTNDPSPNIPPQQHAVIGRLPAAAGIKRGSVQHNALVGISEQHSSCPLANRGVFEVQTVGVVPIRISWHGHECDSAPLVVAGFRIVRV
jgi:hypothetical protein